jgi:hypothetical protein
MHFDVHALDGQQQVVALTLEAASAAIAREMAANRGLSVFSVEQKGGKRLALRIARKGAFKPVLFSIELLSLLGGRGALPPPAGLVQLRPHLFCLGGQRPPSFIELDDSVDRGGRRVSPARERGTHRLRLASDQSDIQHARDARRVRVRGAWASPLALRAWSPRPSW